MSTGFVLETSTGGETFFSLEAGAHERADVSFAEEGGRFALVLGSPYRDGPSWVTARDVLAMETGDALALPDSLHGFFAVITGDRCTGEHLVATDRFCGIDLFLCRVNGRLLVSDSVEQIAGRVPSLHLDAAGVLQYLDMGCMLGETTQFEEIKRVGASTVVEISKGGVKRSSRYWDYSQLDAPAETPDRIENLFNAHVRDAFELCETAALPLTGGIDCRAILSACPPVGERLRCYTFGGSRNTDTLMATRICRKLELPHTVIPVDGDSHGRYMENLRRLAGECNGLVNFYLFAPMFECFEAASASCDLMLTGIGGEFLRGCLFFNRLEGNTSVGRLPALMAGRYAVNPCEQLLKSPDGTGGRQVVRESFGHLFDSLGVSDPYLATECFYLSNRVGNFTARATRPAGMHMKIWEPWLNTGVLEAARRIPNADKAGYRVHREIIMRNSSALSGLLLSTGHPVPYGSRPPFLTVKSKTFRAGRFTLKAANRLSRAALRREFYRPNSLRDMAYYLSRYDGGLLERRLRPGEMRLTGFVSSDPLRGAMGSFLRNDSRLCYVLTNILCTELWLEHLCGLTEIVID